MKHVRTKFRIGKYRFPVDLYYDNGRVFFLYEFNRGINNEIKMMEKRTYHGYAGAPMRDYVLKHFKKDKIWSAPLTEHNKFQIDYLTGENPYAIYKKPIVEFEPNCPTLYEHQRDIAAFMITRRRSIIDGEMGVGKTLAFFELAWYVGPENVWYMSNTSGLRSTRKEIVKWNMTIPFELMTYNKLTTRMRNLEGQEFVPPQVVCFDEFSLCKSPTSQRSQAAYLLAKAVREYWGDDAYLVGMTGTFTPNTPLDAFMQTRIICPGYLIEGEYTYLRNRLAVTEERDYGTGAHKAIITWKDRDGICDICGEPRDAPQHTENDILDDNDDYHEFKGAINEVAKLHSRLAGGGILLVKKKKDCLDLPDKVFDEIELEPSKATMDIARTLAQSSPTAAEALIRVRALSDGFQYDSEKTGEETCPICNGKGESIDFILKPEYEGTSLPDPVGDVEDWQDHYFDKEMLPCIRCGGRRTIDIFSRKVIEIATPKEEAFKEVLDEHADIGRLVTYGAFTGTIDRMTRTAIDYGWDVIRADGRGWWSNVEEVPDLIMPDGSNAGPDYEGMFQERKDLTRKCVFIGQPGAAGMGLTLTASPTCFNYSLTYNAQDAKQSWDRIHRPGMDKQLGAKILNCFHLPTDRMVYNKLCEKIARQDLVSGLDINMNEVLEALS